MKETINQEPTKEVPVQSSTINQGELEKVKLEEQAAFQEFEKFTTENPDKPIPKELEDKYRLAEENLAKVQRGESIEVNQNQEPANQETSKEDPLRVGETRYNAIGNSIKGARTKLSSWFGKAGSFVKVGAFMALETPENVVAGTKYVGNKIGEGSDYLATKTEQFGDSVEAGTKYVGNKIGEGAGYLEAKTEQFGDWVESSAKSAYSFSAEQYTKAENFVVQKAEIVKDYTDDKIDLTIAVAGFLKEKTGEKLDIAKEGIKNVYDGAIEYGKGAIDSAAFRSRKAKERFKSSWNSFRMDMLQRKAEVQKERLERTKRKLAQFNQVAELEAQFV